MRKVLFFINSLSGGGAEKVLVELVNALSPQKYDITVCTLAGEGIYQSNIAQNVTVSSLVKAKNPFIRKALSWLVLFVLPPKWTYRIFFREKYDIEVAFLEGFPTKLLSGSTNKNAKKLAWVHIDLVNYDKNGRIFKSVEAGREAYRKYDAIYCVSDDVREKFNEKYGLEEKTSTQYNVLDDQRIMELSQEPISFRKDPDQIEYVSVGRLADQKGYDRLIEACCALQQWKNKFHITIVGRGPDEDRLKQMVLDNGLSGTIDFVGFKNNPYPYIGQADCFLCTSRAEGFSTVATEAMILGKPIITTDCAGMRDLFGNEECGLIVDNSTQGIQESILHILENPGCIAQYREAVERRRTVFTKKARIEEMERLLDEI